MTRVDQSRGYLRTLLGRDLPLAATVALAIVNGSDFSPASDTVNSYLSIFARGSPLYDGDLIYYLTWVVITLMTLLIAGIPAALYERVRGLQQSTPGSLAIWLLATVLLTLPAILRALALSED